MNYINLEEDLRVGYTIYSNDTIGLDYVTGSNNLYTTEIGRASCRERV